MATTRRLTQGTTSAHSRGRPHPHDGSRGVARGIRMTVFQARGAARSCATRMDIQFVASVAVITPDPPKSRELLLDALRLPLEASPRSHYFHSQRVEGSN